MANILYRGSAAPTVTNTAGAANAPLTNDQIDKNFYALDSAKFEKSGGTITGATSFDSNVTIGGNLTINGTTTTLNTTTLDVADLNITVAKNATTAAAANGAGLTVAGPTTQATFTYTSADDRWNLNKNLNVSTVYGNLTGNAGTATTLETARTISLIGDVSYTSGSFNGSANVSGTATLATVNSNVGTFGSATAIPVVTVNGKGLVTAVSTIAVSIPSGSISVTGGDLTLSGSTGTPITNATLATVNSNVGTYTKVTVNGKGLVTAASAASTTDISEGTNLYYTDARARAAHSFTAGSGGYDSTTGIITIPTNTNQLTNGAGFITGYTETDTLATVTGRGASTSTNVTLTGSTALTLNAAGTNYITTGSAVGATTGYSLYITTADQTTSYSSGAAYISTGNVDSSGVVRSAGFITIKPGYTNSLATLAGEVTVQGGENRRTTGIGGRVYIYGGSAASTTTSSGYGGSLVLAGGRTFATSGAQTGGSVTIDGGGCYASSGTATAGSVSIGTTDPTPTGQLSGTAAITIGHSNNITTINSYQISITSTASSTSTTTGALKVSGGIGLAGSLYAGGDITATGNVTAYSDIKLKENIVTINSALEKTLGLRGVYYNRKSAPESKRVGVIAQEIQKVLPEVVISNIDSETKEETLSVDYGNITALLIEAIKELNAKVQDLQNQLQLI
jgi:hypothetical protein